MRYREVTDSMKRQVGVAPKPDPPQTTAPVSSSAPMSIPAQETLSHAVSKLESTVQHPAAVSDPPPALQPSRHVNIGAPPGGPAEVGSISEQPQPGPHQQHAPAADAGPAFQLPMSHAQQQPEGKQDTARRRVTSQRQDAVNSKKAVSHQNAVRSKAVMILQLALTGPFSLSPQEAAEGLEQAVFADFAEAGVPGNRSGPISCDLHAWPVLAVVGV